MDIYLQNKLKALQWAKHKKKLMLIKVLENCIAKYYEEFGKPKNTQLKLWN